jgi:hypothetical protein
MTGKFRALALRPPAPAPRCVREFPAFSAVQRRLL